MGRILTVILGGVMLLSASPALAQSPTAGPAVEMFYGGVLGGASVVHRWGATAGIEGGVRIARNLDLIGEGVWAKDAGTKAENLAAKPLVEYLEITQGTSARATVKVPVLMGSGGVRWVFEREGAWRPYVLGTVGMARLDRQTTWTLGGTDITGAINTYGITLGRDLSGQESVLAVGAGAGLLRVASQWYLDAGVRFNSLQAEAGSVKLWRASIGVGFRY